MDTKSITAIIIGLMVSGLILVAFVPIFTEVTAIDDKFENAGMYYIDYNDDVTHTLEFEKLETGFTLTVDDENVTPTTNAIGCTLVAGDNFILRYNTSNSTLQFKGNTQYITAITELSGTITATNFSATCTGTAQGQSEPSSITIDADTDNIYSCTAEKTALIMSNYNSPVFVNGDSDIFGFGQNAVGTNLVLFKVYGTVEDITVEVRDAVTGAIDSSYIVSNLAIDYDEAPNYLDLYTLNKITFTVTKGGDTTNVVFSAYIVPSEVTAEKTVHGDTAFNTVINLIPLIAGLGLLLGAVYYFITRR